MLKITKKEMQKCKVMMSRQAELRLDAAQVFRERFMACVVALLMMVPDYICFSDAELASISA